MLRHIHTADRNVWAAPSLQDLVVNENTCPCLALTLDQLLLACLEHRSSSLSAHDRRALGLVTRASHVRLSKNTSGTARIRTGVSRSLSDAGYPSGKLWSESAMITTTSQRHIISDVHCPFHTVHIIHYHGVPRVLKISLSERSNMYAFLMHMLVLAPAGACSNKRACEP